MTVSVQFIIYFHNFPNDSFLNIFVFSKMKFTQIEWSQTIKYLGVLLDKRLTYRHHIQSTKIKSIKILNIFYSLLCKHSKLTLNNKLLLYKAVFRPVLTYASPIWSECAKTNFNHLQKIQNKILKIILNKPRYFSTNEIHNLTSMPILKDYICKLNQNFTQKCTNSEEESIRALVS